MTNLEIQQSHGRRGGRRISPNAIDEDYKTKGGVLGSSSPQKLAFYGGNETLGPLGIALAVHRRLWLEDHQYTAHEFGTALEKAIIGGGQFAVSPPNLDAVHLQAWVQPSRPVALPDEQYIPLILRALQVVAREKNLSDDCIGALAQTWSRPSELLERLRNAPTEKLPENFSPIDAKLYDSGEPSTQYDDVVGELEAAFIGEISQTKIITFLGAPYSGKRRVISKMIQNTLVSGTYNIRLSSNAHVPLFARNAEGTPLKTIIQDIAIFLGIHVPSKALTDEQADELLVDIKTAAKKYPAAYILAEVPMMGGPLTRLLGGEFLQKIIDAIADPPGQNRILLSGVDDGWLPRRYRTHLVRIDGYRTISAVAHSFNLKVKLNDSVKGARANDSIVTLLSTLLDTAWDRPSEKLEAAYERAEQALSMCKSDISETTSPWDHEAVLFLASAICDQLGMSSGTLVVLEFLTLSLDGVLLSSLIRLLSRDSEQGSREPIDAERECNTLLSALRFICKRSNVFDQSGLGKQGNGEFLYELLPPFRRIFETEFLLRDAQRFRQKNSAIANLARDRSREIRLNSSANDEHLDFYVVREAQALRHAQIAISPQLLDQDVCQVQSSRRALGRRLLDNFLISEALEHLSAVEAFRFLYFDVFRAEIDPEHRLSRTYQRDDFRITLLMGFCSAGKPFYLDDYNSDKGWDDWDKLSKILPAKDRIEFLNSIGISAKRMGAWGVLAQAGIKARGILEKEKQTTGWVDIARIVRAETDANILRCGTDIPTLAKIRSDIEIAQNHLQDGDALNKLQVRRGEVLTLMGHLDDAQQVFQNLEEAIAEAEFRSACSVGAWRGSPLVGHGARRYLRLLCEMARRDVPQTRRDGYLDHAEDLFTSDIRRLVQYPGERAILHLDRILIAVRRGKYDYAERLLMAVEHPLTSFTASVSARVNFEWTYAGIALDLLELHVKMNDEVRDEIFNRTSQSIERLICLTQTYELPLFRSIGEMQAAKWIRLRDEAPHPHIEHFDRFLFGGRSAASLRSGASDTFAKVGFNLYPSSVY